LLALGLTEGEIDGLIDGLTLGERLGLKLTPAGLNANRTPAANAPGL
jgi:hypothetical protein